MKKSLFRKASQEIHHILWNMNIHTLVQTLELVTTTRCRYQRYMLSLFTCMQVVLRGLLILIVL